MPRHTRRSAAAAAAAEPAAKPEADDGPAPQPPAKRAKTAAAAPAQTDISVGDALPSGEVLQQDGTPVNLAGDHASGILALFAYPKASTPGCTRQTSGFGDAYAELASLGVAVFGISADSPAAQSTFRTKTGVEFDLLSDPEYTLLAPLGAKKSPKGVIRSHWVFVDGKAVLVEHTVKPDDSPARVLEAVKKALDSGEATQVEQEDAESDRKEDPEDPKDLKDEGAEKGAETGAEKKNDKEDSEEDSKEDAEQDAGPGEAAGPETAGAPAETAATA